MFLSPPFFQDAMEYCIIFSIDDEPPSSLLPLMLTCRHFYNLLRPSNNPRLYRHIFYRKFDIATLSRRFPSSSNDVVARFLSELKRRFRAMRCIRSGDVHRPRLQGALRLVAYLMVLEHDALNYRHLLDAALLALLDRYINECLHQGHNLWPIEDTCNALAVALFLHMTLQGAWTIALHFLPFGESPSTGSWMIAATMSRIFYSRSLSPGSGFVPFLLIPSSLLPT